MMSKKKILAATAVFIIPVAFLLIDLDWDGLVNITEFRVGSSFIDSDTDGDGLEDGLEVNVWGTDPLVTDTDKDGLDDGAEVSTHGTNPLLADTDGDGLDDGSEAISYGTDPSEIDTDKDNLSDRVEILIYGSDPLVADTDEDGLDDGSEVNFHGTNPLDNDVDNDRLLDGLEVNGWIISVGGLPRRVVSDPFSRDSDRDNLGDWSEYVTYGSDPKSLDTDGDGISDSMEVLYGTDLTDPLNLPLLLDDGPGYPRLLFEIDHMTGYVPSPEVVSYLVSYLEDYLGVEVRVIFDEITLKELVEIGVSPDSFSNLELVSIKRRFHDFPTTHLYVFYAGGLDEETGGLASDSFGIALNGKYISGNIARERTVLLHELGHCLRLEHCNNPGCVMQVEAIFENPVYCSSCWAKRNLIDVWSVDEPWTRR